MALPNLILPIRFSSSLDENNLYFPYEESQLLAGTSNNLPVDSYYFETVPKKPIHFKVLGTASLDFSTPLSDYTGSVKIVSIPYSLLDASGNNLIAESGNTTVIGETAFKQDLGSPITGSFELIVTSSIDFNSVIFFQLEGNGSLLSGGVTNGSFTISSTSTGSSIDLGVEPYLNGLFYGTDCDVMQGNVTNNIPNPFLQDIDYNDGTIIPSNVTALISGSALKGTVPQSYYTSLAQTNIRYNGSINQSQQINEYLPTTIDDFGKPTNIGTFGQTPSVDNKKTLLVYADKIESLDPDLKDASAASIKFIIDENEEIREPNLTSEAIGDIQYAFPENENAFIELTKPPVGSGLTLLNGKQRILKGGYRVTPILYTQTGSNPGRYTSTIGLVNPSDAITGTVSNVTAKNSFRESTTYGSSGLGATNFGQPVLLPGADLAGQTIGAGVEAWSSGGGFEDYFDIENQMIGLSNPGGNSQPAIYKNYAFEASNKIFNGSIESLIDAQFSFTNASNQDDIITISLYLQASPLVFSTTGILTPASGTSVFFQQQILVPANSSGNKIRIQKRIAPGIDWKKNTGGLFQFINNDPIAWFRMERSNNLIPDVSTPAIPSVYLEYEDTYWNMDQSPIPNPISAPTAPFFKYPSGSYQGQAFNEMSSSLEGIIYVPNDGSNMTSLNVFYNGGVKQQNITSSGFFPIIENWFLLPGDQFRYNDDELLTYNVKQVFAPGVNSPNRITDNKHLEIHFTTSIPSGSVNLDQFYCRRFVEDGTFIYFDEKYPGGKDGTSSGPAIVKPNYVTDGLDLSVDSFVLKLLEKGVIE